MSEFIKAEQELASVEVKVGGENQRLILTKNFVSIHCKKWIFREDTSFIPVNSIDSIFFGWKRYWILLVLAVVFLVGGVAPNLEKTVHFGFLFLGAVFLIVFWLSKTHLLLVRSTRESLGGVPISEDDAKKLIFSITELLSKR